MQEQGCLEYVREPEWKVREVPVSRMIIGYVADQWFYCESRQTATVQ
jgi:hypothetical protein